VLKTFSLFGIQVYSYYVGIIVAVIVGVLYGSIELRKNKYTYKQLVILWVLLITSFFIGARLFNILLNTKYYILTPEAIFELKLHNFSIYGGIFGCVFTAFILQRVMRRSVMRFFDRLTIPFLFCFVIAKIGCFLNGCCYGKPSNSFLAVSFPKPETPLSVLTTILNVMTQTPTKVYPTQLFEAVLVALFCLLHI